MEEWKKKRREKLSPFVFIHIKNWKEARKSGEEKVIVEEAAREEKEKKVKDNTFYIGCRWLKKEEKKENEECKHMTRTKNETY